MPGPTEFARTTAEFQHQTFTAWKDAVEKSFEVGAQLLSLQKEYTLRAADILGAGVPKKSS